MERIKKKKDMNWANEEMESLNLGDSRLNKRYSKMLKDLGNRPSEKITVSCEKLSEVKAAYRFIDNNKVNKDKILEAHRDATIERIKKEKVVLFVQDSTEIDHSSKKSTEGLGPIGGQEYRSGFYLHPTIAMTEKRVILGTVKEKVWVRDYKKEEDSEKKKQKIISK